MRFIEVKATFEGHEERDLQLDMKGNLVKKWNDMVRKYRLKLHFEILRSEEPIEMTAVEYGDMIRVIMK
jgi:hypothetical protein